MNIGQFFYCKGLQSGEVNEIRIAVSLKDEHIEMDLDTGASVTVISEHF